MKTQKATYAYFALGLVLLLFIAVQVEATSSEGESSESILSRMTVEEKVGQMLMVKAMENQDGEPDERTKQLIQDFGAGSVIFYSFPEPRATASYTNKMQEWAQSSPAGLPLLVGSDLEYGLKANVAGETTLLPHQMGIGATGKPELANQAATITAKEGRSMGVHWNFAPAADLNTNPNNPVIGVRSFGSDPDTVSSFVKSAVEGYQNNGMIATLKHYPGHGDTSTDSHYGLPRVSYSRKELEKHLKPFEAGIDAGADAVMTAHILVDSVDPERPATISKKVVTDLLRNEQGFTGVIVTDAMNMGAIEDNFGKAEAAVNAVKAGVDVVMSAGDYWDALEIRDGLLEAVKDGEISTSTIDESVKRVLDLKKDYGLLDGNNASDPEEAKRIAGSKKNRDAASKIARKAVTLVRDDDDMVPIRGNGSKLLLVGVKDSVHLLKDELEGLLPDLDLSVYRTPSSNDYNDWSPSDSGIEKAAEMASGAETVILLTYSGGQLAEGQIDLARQLIDSNKNTIVIAEGLPYDYRNFPKVSTFIATYSYNRWNAPTDGHGVMTKAVAEVLTGEIRAEGALPVYLQDNDND